MRRKILMLLSISGILFFNSINITNASQKPTVYAGVQSEMSYILEETKRENTYVYSGIQETVYRSLRNPVIVTSPPEPEQKEESMFDIGMSDSDIRLLAMVMMAEAEGESEYGKRLVIDTILNRIDSEYFPNSVTGVVYQKDQFTSMWNGRINEVVATEESCQLVREELVARKNKEVIFFTAGGYGRFGRNLFSEGNHYFASYR